MALKVTLTEDEEELLRVYRAEQGRIQERKSRAIVKALGSPDTVRRLGRNYGKGSGGGSEVRDPYLQGRRDALRELFESGGLPEAQLGLEVLYLLPDTFVKFYADLFHQALDTNESAASGKGGGIDKAKGTTGTVLGSESRAQAQGTGKKYRKPKGSIRSENAMRVKTRVDQELLSLAHLGGIGLRRSKETNHSGTGVTLGQGTNENGRIGQCRGRVEGRNGDTKGCGKFLKNSWEYCPECGTKVERA